MNNITIRNAKLIFKNFSGKGSQFNPAGRRNFSVLIEDPNLIRDLIDDGWNLKRLKPRDEDVQQNYHLPVAVFYGKYPPQITVISGNSKTLLDESTVQMLDWAYIQKVDLTIHPRPYEIGGRSGIKAYLRTMYVTVEEDELDAEYANFGEEPIPF